jgi:3-hydroxybutyryl-CoA dehydrogenase
METMENEVGNSVGISVIGAGTMGHSIAMSFSQAGYKVALHDTSEKFLERARSLIHSGLCTLLDAGILDGWATAEGIKSRIQLTTDLEKAVKDKAIVVEAINEDANAKYDLFKSIDPIIGNETIIASNTSYLNVFEIYNFRNPQNIVIAHWYNPAHIIPLVEVVPGPETSEDTKKKMIDALSRCGKNPVLLKKYIPGFIGNRLQSALNLEAYYLLDEGIVEPEELDKVAALSFGLRLPILGIAKRCDFTGLDLVQKILSNKSYHPPEVRGKCDAINHLIESGKLGVKTLHGFYNYQQTNEVDVLRDRDIKLIKLKEFIDRL